MGLDMFLNAEHYLSQYNPDEKLVADSISDLMRLSDKLKLNTVSCEAAYWRKANAIHNWFVKNVQEGNDECQKSYVSRDQLEGLLDACRQVLHNKSLAKTLLPTGAGFFFGSTEFDEYYFDTLTYTVEQIEPLLGKEYDNWDFYYRSSW